MKTDFSTWTHENLALIARQLADENEALKADLKTALAAWRELLHKQG